MMFLRLLLLPLAVAQCSSTERRLTYDRIVGYEPRSKVTDYAAIDLDQFMMENRLSKGQLIKARNVYQFGGNSESIAKVTLVNPQGSYSFPPGTKVMGIDKVGQDVEGALAKRLVWDDQQAGKPVEAHIKYFVSDIQDSYVGCQVGGLYTFEMANLDGCFNDTGKITILEEETEVTKGVDVQYEYEIRPNNYNGRTLQGFSTEADKRMRGCDDCPYYEDFDKFVRYYGDPDYADKWVMAAFFRESTSFSKQRGDADFSLYDSRVPVVEAISKGTAYMSVFMYVIRQLEDAITDCEKGCKLAECNDGRVHAIDVAVAFYAGSLEGTDGQGEGVLFYNLADKRALDFRTCGESGQEEEGTSYVNLEIIDEFKKAQINVREKKCSAAKKNKARIVNLMKVPLVQGVLRYAYIRAFENPDDDYDDSDKAEAEGASFAAAVLPFVHHCNAPDSHTIYHNMRVGSDANKLDFGALKKAFERNYECMGITCEQVGGVWTVNGWAAGAAPCGSSSSASGSNAGVAIGAVFGAAVGGILLALVFTRLRRKRYHPKKTNSNIAAVSEIA